MLAHHVDNWRVVPRVLIFSYMIAVASALHWYFDFEVKYTEKCDVKVMELVLEDKPKDIKAAKEAGSGKPAIIYAALPSRQMLLH